MCVATPDFFPNTFNVHNTMRPRDRLLHRFLTDMVYYIEYCNFAVIHCLSIIHLKYYIEDIAECVWTLIYQIISIICYDFKTK